MSTQVKTDIPSILAAGNTEPSRSGGSFVSLPRAAILDKAELGASNRRPYLDFEFGEADLATISVLYLNECDESC